MSTDTYTGYWAPGNGSGSGTGMKVDPSQFPDAANVTTPFGGGSLREQHLAAIGQPGTLGPNLQPGTGGLVSPDAATSPWVQGYRGDPSQIPDAWRAADMSKSPLVAQEQGQGQGQGQGALLQRLLQLMMGGGSSSGGASGGGSGQLSQAQLQQFYQAIMQLLGGRSGGS